MEVGQAVEGLSALAHPSRLSVFRLLVQAGGAGHPAGEIARAVGVPPSTLSTHLAILARAGLVSMRRKGRSLIYAVDFAATGALLGFLVDDCCAGRPEICGSLAAVRSVGGCAG